MTNKTREMEDKIRRRKIKDHVKNIVELVEDEAFPARRNITDYVLLLISEFDFDLSSELDIYIEKLYKNYDHTS